MATKLLKIDSGVGYFLDCKGGYALIDQVVKEDLSRLVDQTLEVEEVEWDPYDEALLKNHAHQIIYKGVLRKLEDLRSRRQEFMDESARLFLEDYEKYKKS